MTKPSGGRPQELVGLLSNFPPESTRAFEEAAVDLLKSLTPAGSSQLEDLTKDSTLNRDVRYSAFFAYGTFLRRAGKFSTVLDLLDAADAEFRVFGTYHHLKAMALAGRGEPHDLQLAIASALKASELLPGHAGVLHSYVLLRISDLEQRISLSEIATTTEQLEILDQSDHMLSQVLNERPRYAKFHSTLARLESLRGRHEDAQRSLSRALELEDPAAHDFSLRIVGYNQILSRVVLRQALATVAKESAEAANAANDAKSSIQGFVDQMQTRYLELLGIFAAIIGIVITGVQVSTSLGFADGARLMLIVTGSMLILFTAIASVVERPVKYVWTLAGFGGFTIALGFLAGFISF
jgi:tetratricopeptide (TPR) repeat protein